MQDMYGELVSEAEAATGLGFADVYELRRWQTEMGHKVADLEHQLRTAISDGENFRWAGQRMQVVLEKTAAFLGQLHDPSEEVPDLLLAIGVVNGKSVDWDHRLKGWFPKEKTDDQSLHE